jgi:SET domain-containing protein
MSIIIKPIYDLEVRYIDDVKGFGVFTNENIEKGNIVEVCYSLKLKQSEIQHPNTDYLFYYNSTKEHYLPFGYGSIYNHSDDANLIWNILPEKGIMKFFSIKDITIGEELTHNYGKLYWQYRQKKLI